MKLSTTVRNLCLTLLFFICKLNTKYTIFTRWYLGRYTYLKNVWIWKLEPFSNAILKMVRVRFLKFLHIITGILFTDTKLYLNLHTDINLCGVLNKKDNSLSLTPLPSRHITVSYRNHITTYMMYSHCFKCWMKHDVCSFKTKIE